MNTRLIHLLNDALFLNLEETATLLDEDLRKLAIQVQDEQDTVQGEIDKAWGKLRDKATWADGQKFGRVLRSLEAHFPQLRKLEILEDRIKTEQFARAAAARGIGAAQAKVLELTHRAVCDYSKVSA